MSSNDTATIKSDDSSVKDSVITRTDETIDKSIPSSPTAGRRNKRKKKKVEKIEIQLYINKVAYEYGVMCTFCTIRPAIFHCAECPDFLCNEDDIIKHQTLKRKNHIRQKISKYDLNGAAKVVTRAVRFMQHLIKLQKRCRIIFKRYFDKETLNHYYYNTKYNTVSWRKPYCLRKQELFPFLTEDEAATRIQSLYKAWIARDITRQLLLKYYRKLFDRNSGNFYYAFHGKSKIIPKSNWKKPFYCHRRSFPTDIPLIYTVDVAAIIIQRKWRAILIRELWRTLARASLEQLWDPLKGKWNYYDKDKSILLENELKIMRGQPWDPNNVEEWTIERVSLFLRRIGLKQLVKPFIEYGVDGNTILILDDEDYENMNIFNRIQRKKIEVELYRIYPHEKRYRVSEDILIKRDKIRKFRLFTSAAIKIQRLYRKYLLKINKKIENEKNRLLEIERNNNRIIEESKVWWSERNDIPSKLVNDGLFHNYNQIENENDNKIKLPLIKSFGRKRDHMTTKGWGRRGSKGQWITISSDITVDKNHDIMLPMIIDKHPTRIFTEKLIKSGYDKRRLQKFLGLSVDPYEFTIEHKKVIEVESEL